MAQKSCTTCDQIVPTHFQSKKIIFCITCQAQKVSFSGFVKPTTDEGVFSQCLLCFQKTQNEPLCSDCENLIVTDVGIQNMREYDRRPWLVQASGTLMGPFPTQKVEQLIRSKELGMFDLIQRPYGRWHYVREEDEFKAIVDELRKGSSPREDTIGATPTTITETFYPVESQPVVASVGSEPARNHRSLFILILVLLIFTIAFYITQQYSKPLVTYPKVVGNIDAIISNAAFEKSIGNFERSITLYQAAWTVRNDEPDIGSNLALLYLRVGKNEEAEKILDKYPLTNPAQRNFTEFTMAHSILNLANKKFDDAAHELKSVLDLNHVFIPASLNLASVEILRGNYEKAAGILADVPSDKDTDGVTLILTTEVALKIFDKKNDVQILSQVAKRIESYFEVSQSFKQELGLALTMLRLKAGNKEIANLILEQILDSDPDLVQAFENNLMVYSGLTKWDHLLPWCEAVHRELNDSHLASAFLAYCYLQSGNPNEAISTIEKIAKNHDSLVESMYAYILRRAGNFEKSESFLRIALTKSYAQADRALPLYVKASSCFSNEDLECAKSFWLQVLNKDASSLGANAGLANVYYRQNNLKESEAYLKKGFEISRHYTPLIKIKYELERAKK